MRLLHPRQKLHDKTVVTIGTFDGVHLGHKEIFKKVTEISRRYNLKSVLITFEPPPKRFFSNGKIENLTTLSEKTEILADIGIDYLLVLPFNKELVNTSWNKFVRHTLMDSLNVQYLVVGYDFRMGKDQEGSPDKLLEMPFFVNILSPFSIKGEPVKSSYIRELIQKRKIEKANRFLGYNYILTGCIVKGLGIASKIGFPSLNLRIMPEKLLPPSGVYAIEAPATGDFGMLYIGNRPTHGIDKMTVEIHFLNPGKILNKREISIRIVKKIRNEKKFDSENELIQQLTVDKKHTNALFRDENL